MGVDVTASMESLCDSVAIFLPAGGLIEIAGEVDREGSSVVAEGPHSFLNDFWQHDVIKGNYC